MIPQSINNWLTENYGSRRGALSTLRFRAANMLGNYRVYKDIDWDSIDRLVFVCKGNICRSAYSEAFAKSLGVEAISCGISTDPGYPANNIAMEVGAQRGFDLSQHKTTPVKSVNFKESDLILAMEPWQAEHMSKNHSGYNGCTLLGLWGKPKKPYIHDPYGAPIHYFDNCFNFLEGSIHEIVSRIRKD